MKQHKQSFAFPPRELQDIKRRMLYWAARYNILLFLDSNSYPDTHGAFDCICAAGATDSFTAGPDVLQQLAAQQQSWLFGHICYDFPNNQDRIPSLHQASLSFPELIFFKPEIVCYIRRDTHEVVIESSSRTPECIWHEICSMRLPGSISLPEIRFKKRISQADYLDIIARLKKHIIDGDCYEINFCNEAFCDNAVIDPLPVFDQLNRLSPAPFAAYYRMEDHYLMCASPERYLRQEQQQLIAQPIKGTARRDILNPEQDALLKDALQQSIKERAENVMITDLMRNDLARCCETGSVAVEELFGIYSFPQVHQMISTITGTLRSDKDLADILQATFPMGSMTGAPKHMVMQLIEQYEQARRELFSGTVGYISPDGNFDFNVVIRSLFYNARNHYLSYQTGGAITYESDAAQEWEETLLKASAIEKVFTPA